MSQAVTVEILLPKDWKRLQMPSALQTRLQTLLDQQDRGGRLSAIERREAEALVELSEMLTLLKLRLKRRNGVRGR